MNQIYACREGKEVPFTDAKIVRTATTQSRSISRSIFSKLLLGFFVFLAIGIQESQGQVFSNPINGVIAAGVNPYTTGQVTDPNVTATGIGRGAGLNGGIGSVNTYIGYGFTTNPSIDLADYFEWSFDANAGSEIDLTTFQFDLLADANGPTFFELRSSADGFTAALGTVALGSNTISLSAAAFQNATAPITFRLYGWGALAGLGYAAIDNFIFNGTVCQIPTVSNPTPTPQSVCIGTAATALSVMGTGTNITYAWFKDADATVGGGTAVGTNSPSYTPLTDVAGDSWYYVTVTGDCGTATSTVSAKVTVKPLPQGSLTVNGPFCVSGAPMLTWTSTAGTGPFSFTYQETPTSPTNQNNPAVVSGVAFAPFTTPITSNSIYTVISVTDASLPVGCVRSTGFTDGSETIVVSPTVSATTMTGTSPVTVCVAPYTVPGGAITTVNADAATIVWTENGFGSITAGGNTLTPTYTPTAADGGTQVTLTMTVNGTAACAMATASTTFVIDFRPAVSGVIQVAAATEICAGSIGGVNVNLAGTPLFTGTFTVTNQTSAAVTTQNWTSMVLGGPQNINIDAVNLQNATNTPITYRVSWGTLTDVFGCTGILQNFTDIIVNPRPAAVLSAGTGTVLGGNNCPGTVININVLAPAGNTIPSTFTWVATAANGAVLTNNSGSNVPYGNNAISTNLGLLCNNDPAVNPITFTITPFANHSNCPGTVVTTTASILDATGPALTGTLPGTAVGNVCMPGQATYQPTTAAINALYSDNCPGAVTTTLLTATLDNPLGGAATNCSWRWTYIYSVSDACGNTTAANVVFSGGDTQIPVITNAVGSLNSTVSYCDAAALVTAQALWNTGATALVATDNCGTPTVSQVSAGVFAQGACPHSGTITNTYQATDGCGLNSVIFTQTITIVDVTGPQVSTSIPTSTVLNIGAGANCTVPLPDYVTMANFVGGVTTIQASTVDCAAPGLGLPPSGAVSFVQSPAAGTPVTGIGGSIVVTITARDVCNNPTTIQFTVNFQDLTPPVAVCKSSTPTIYVDLNAQGNSTLTPKFFDNGSYDNCVPVPNAPSTLVYTLQSTTGNGFAGNPFPPYTFTCEDVGPQTVRLLVTDANGNVDPAGCLVNVIVRDVTAPVFVTGCPVGPLVRSKDLGCTTTLENFISTLGLSASDACGTPTLSQAPIAGTVFGAGVASTVVTITATDANGNTTTCNFTVNFVDNIAPSIACPVTITPAAPATVTVSGNTFTVTTGAGNTDCQVIITYATPTASDNCAVFPFPTTITPVRIAGPASGSAFFYGTTVVTWMATDAAGNTSTCSFNVVINDNTIPVINCALFNATKEVNPNTALCKYTHSGTGWDVTATDNCLANVTYRYTATGATTILSSANRTSLNGAVFNLGQTTVSAIAYDGVNFSGNASVACTFIVNVTDNVAPTVVCPASFSVVTNAGAGCGATVPASSLVPTLGPVPDFCATVLEWDITGATPNSSGLGQMPNFRFLSTGNGITTVTYRISDAAGNSNTCSFTVTVTNPGTASIGSNISVGQNLNTTSTITFTAGGNPNFNGLYTFTYSKQQTTGVGAGAAVTGLTVQTTGGFNVVTVAQQNNVIGTFVYTLTGATDASGCPLAITGPATATITVVPAVPNFTPTIGMDISNFTANPPVTSSNQRDFVAGVLELAGSASTGQVVFVISKLAGYTMTFNPTATSVAFGGSTAVQNNDWIINDSNPFFITCTLKPGASVAANGSSLVGFTLTRNVGTGSGSANLGVTIANGSGGDTNNFDNGVNRFIIGL